MAVEISQNQNTFFPSLVSGLQDKTSLVYLSSNYPSVTIDQVTVANDIKTTDETAGEETVIVSVTPKISEAILQPLIEDPEFARFYTTANYINNLRIRIIACFGNQGSNLDFITQRMNEYSAGLMSVSGAENADQFYNSLINAIGPSNYALLSPIGPFGSESILDILKTNLQDKIYYDQTSTNEGIIVCDVAANDAIVKDKDGRVLKDKKVRAVLKNADLPNSQQFQNYVLENIVLKTFEFRLGKTEQYTNTDLSNIRFYAFTYMDNTAFLEGQGISKEYAIAQEERLVVK